VPENLVLFVQTATPSDYGAFARIVIQHLGEEDAHAKRLFGESASAVDAAFDALNLKDGDKIALLGGLSSFFPSHLAKRHQERLIAPKADALMGAVALAAKLAAGTLLQSQGRA
jgi:glucosamine kinase